MHRNIPSLALALLAGVAMTGRISADMIPLRFIDTYETERYLNEATPRKWAQTLIQHDPGSGGTIYSDRKVSTSRETSELIYFFQTNRPLEELKLTAGNYGTYGSYVQLALSNGQTAANGAFVWQYSGNKSTNSWTQNDPVVLDTTGDPAFQNIRSFAVKATLYDGYYDYGNPEAILKDLTIEGKADSSSQALTPVSYHDDYTTNKYLTDTHSITVPDPAGELVWEPSSGDHINAGTGYVGYDYVTEPASGSGNPYLGTAYLVYKFDGDYPLQDIQVHATGKSVPNAHVSIEVSPDGSVWEYYDGFTDGDFSHLSPDANRMLHIDTTGDSDYQGLSSFYVRVGLNTDYYYYGYPGSAVYALDVLAYYDASLGPTGLTATLLGEPRAYFEEIPEPCSLLMLGIATATGMLRRRRRS
ncbi:MAG: PEP-CTERM sorting domain-containing protein [Candidatus Pacebacteria bacterium]|nr:PEP-CTERM sorting domain-containing protein [Candidatus Paceibacterota bacterium]